LLKAHENMIHSIAKRYSNRIASGNVSYDDLVQEGRLGLFKAAETYDPKKGTKFSTHAHNWIRQYIGRAAEKETENIRVPSNVQWHQTKLRRAAERFYAQHGYEPSDEQLSKLTGLSARQMRTAQSAKGRTFSTDIPIGEEGTTFKDVLAAPSPSEENTTRQRVARSIFLHSDLTPLEAEIISRKYGFVDGVERSSSQVARELRLSKQRISQLEKRAFQKMSGQRRTSQASGRYPRIRHFLSSYRTKRS